MAHPFRSKLFSVPSDPGLEACATKNSGHVSLKDRANLVGSHVNKIHTALLRIAALDPKLKDRLKISATEVNSQTYGSSSAQAVLMYKQDRKIINFSYQQAADDIVGIMTISRLDDEIKAIEDREGPTPPAPPPAPTRLQIAADALARSRTAVAFALGQLRRLETDINLIDSLDGNAKVIAIQNLGRNHARNIAVVSKRLLVGDPLSASFRSALRKAIELTEQNARETSSLKDEGSVGRCDKTLKQNGGRVPLASTTRTDPDPRVSVCDSFFVTTTKADLQRDVMTHEFYHLVGVADTSGVDTTAKALNNANTLAQIVAWINDRTRRVNSDGQEEAIPPLPSP